MPWLPPWHTEQHVRNHSALMGLGKREDMWQKDIVSVTHVGGFWLRSLETLSVVADTPSECCSQASKSPSHNQHSSLLPSVNQSLPSRGFITLG